MSIRKTLTLLFIISISLLVGAGSYSANTYKSLVDESLEVSENYSSMEALALTTQVHFKKQVQEWKNILLRGTDSTLYDRYLDQFDNEERLTKQYITQLISRLDMYNSTRDTALVFLSAHTTLSEQYREALPAFKLAEHSPHITVDKYVRGIDREPTDLIDKLVKQLKEKKSHALSQLKNDIDSALQSLVITLTCFALVLITIIVITLNRVVIRPLLSATSIATEISTGNYSNRVQFGDISNENNRLLQALDSMQTSIAQSALEIAENNKELRNALHHAQESERIRSSFIANLNHELITPMTGVLGLIELLSDTQLDSTQKEYISLASDSGNRFLKTVNDVINLSHIETDRFTLSEEDFNLKQCLSEINNNYAIKIRETPLTFSFLIPDELPLWVYGDHNNLQQTLSILLDNAIKFTEAGSIQFETMIQAINKSTVLLKFTVSDTGKGIATETLDDIFDSFKQADGSMSRSHEGLGIGLSIFYKVVTLMGGEVSVDTTEGKGSTFNFNIPFKITSQNANSTEKNKPLQ